MAFPANINPRSTHQEPIPFSSTSFIPISLSNPIPCQILHLQLPLPILPPISSFPIISASVSSIAHMSFDPCTTHLATPCPSLALPCQTRPRPAVHHYC
ncbi:hypothetical protein E2C01_071311 [Portunus trituberculatus]|uniref:Uncharacterized protein n=1 Tax=Portunus trituberculatus TaxID=210409 RepID=A0A5B7I4N5_PORTR|nr:hypothetical protein [Portunus trituberculatus]